MFKKKLIQCAVQVNRDAVKRMSIDGIEHVIVSSFTLPDDVVMNGGLYPADEIAKGFMSLERTLAPIEHPTDSQGNFISANDPVAIHNFHAGAFNVNVSRVNGRVHIEKFINVQEAMRTDRGKRLMDRIIELETNAEARPIHTSVGVWLEVEETKEPMTNTEGKEYTWIARNMVFDHDAILLDSVGAAQPHQGVGMAVNRKGQEVEVDRVVLETATVKPSKTFPLADSGRTWDSSAAVKRVRAHVNAEDVPNADYAKYFLWVDPENATEFGGYKLPFVDIIDGAPHAIPNALRNAAARLGQTQGPTEAEKTRIQGIIDAYLTKLTSNADGLSHQNLIDQLGNQIRGTVAAEWMYVADVFDDVVIFETNVGLFQVPYEISDGTARIVGIPIRVDRVTTYNPKTNSDKGDAMRELMLQALAAAGITVNADISDADLMAKYNDMQAAQNSKDDGQPAGGDLAQVVANALKPLSDEIAGLKTKLSANEDAEITRLVGIVVNSGKYAELDEAAVKALPLETLKKMAGNCGTSHGLPFFNNSSTQGPNFGGPEQMPQ